MSAGRVASTLRVLGHLARADYLERVRRHSFLVTLAVAVYFAYLAIPPNHSRYATLQISEWRGAYGSAWVGCMVSLMTSIFLSMTGFYLVKNAIERDRLTGVGQILAASPLAKWQYTLGKWLSNLAVLGTMVGTVAVTAIGMQLLRGEDPRIDLLALFAPFLVVTIPAMALIAALAVLFESLPGLRAGLGNVVYFFLFLIVFAGLDVRGDVRGTGLGGPAGVSSVLPTMIDAVARESGTPRDSLRFSLGFNIRQKGTFDLRTFHWDGMRWTAADLAPRLAWFGIGAGLALVAALPFDRFDAVRVPARRSRRRRGRSDEAEEDETPGASIEGSERPAVAGVPSTITSATQLTVAPAGFRWLALIGAELRLALSATSRPWRLIAIGLAVANVFAPLPIARSWLLPFAWIWPLLLWSALGAREARHGTEALVFSSPRPLARQLTAIWLSGVVIAALMGVGVGARLAIGGDGVGAAAWLVGAAFIPSLALACGVWTGSGKLFEVLYLMLWYSGPMSRVPILDFAGTTPELVAGGAWRGFAAATVALVALAFAGRRRRLRR